MLTEAKEIVKLAWPIILTMLLHFMTSVTSMVFCGRLGKDTMDAVSLASMVVNVFGFATTMGLASACDTLFAQSYGSSNKANMGVVLQRGILILLLTCIPTFALFVNTEHILVVAGQNKDIARNAGVYTKIFIAGLPGMAISQVLRRFVYVQGIIVAQIVVMVLANVINIAAHFLFITALQMGVSGAAISFSITNWGISILYGLYIVIWKKYKDLWKGWSTECLDDWGEFFSLAVPGMLMLLMEWISAEVITFISGLLGTVELAAYTITYNTVMFVSMIPIGLSFGITVRVGMNLGANDAQLARCTARVAMVFAASLGLLIGVIVLCLRTVIPHIFTLEREVISIAESMIYLMALYLVFSGGQQVLDGVVRGTGNQAYGAIVNITAYLIICLPIAIPVMLKTDVNVRGGYIGLASGAFYQAVLFLIGILRMDWSKQAELAQERSKITPDKITLETGTNITGPTDVHIPLHEIKSSSGGERQEVKSDAKHKPTIDTLPYHTLSENGHLNGYGSTIRRHDDNDLDLDLLSRATYSYEEQYHIKTDEYQLIRQGDEGNPESTEKENVSKRKTSRGAFICKRLSVVVTFVAILGVAIWLDTFLSALKHEKGQ